MFLNNEPEYQGFRGNPNLKGPGNKTSWTLEMIDEWAKCSEDPIYFITKYVKLVHVDLGVMDFVLRDYQEEFILLMHKHRYVAANMARQIGKSQTVAAYILWFIMFNKRKHVGVLANKLDTAWEIMERIQFAYQELPIWMQHNVIDWNKGSFRLENGSKVTAASSSPNNVRGKSFALCYVDESAHVPDPDKFFRSVRATISSGKHSKLVQTSTPNGIANHFYKTITLGKKIGEPEWNGYYVMEVPWWRVPGRGPEWKEAELASTNYDTEAFAQEHEIQFLGSSGSLISGDCLKRLEIKTTPIVPVAFDKDGMRQYERPIAGHKYVLCADVSRGRGLDYSAFSVIDITVLPYKQVCTYRSNFILPSDYAGVIFNIAKYYDHAHVLIEINDLGQQVADILYDDYEYDNIIYTEAAGQRGKKVSLTYGSKKDRGLRTTIKTKNIGCQILKIMVESFKLEIMDKATVHELSSFVKKNQSYQAEPGAHDDLVMGLVIFAWLSDQQFFKDLTDINTIRELREKSEEEMMANLIPFGIVDYGQMANDPDLVIDDVDVSDNFLLQEFY